MGQSKLSVENFLKEEKSTLTNVLATIQEDGQSPDKVIISLWNKSSSACDASFSISKDQIESVEKTDNKHSSFGKTYTVVKVNFKKNASISMADLFKQLNSGTFRVLQDWRKDPFSRYPYGNGIA